MVLKKAFQTTVKNSSWPEKGATFIIHQIVKHCKILHAIFLMLGISDERVKESIKC